MYLSRPKPPIPPAKSDNIAQECFFDTNELLYRGFGCTLTGVSSFKLNCVLSRVMGFRVEN